MSGKLADWAGDFMAEGMPFVVPAGYKTELLSDQREVSRPPAMFVYDETEQNRGHQFIGAHAVVSSRVSLDHFPVGSGARGTIFLTLENNRLICPRITDDESSKGFLKYLESVNQPGNRDSQYFANFSISESVIELNDMASCKLPGEVLWVTPDEPFNWGMWVLQTLPAIHLAEQRGLDATILCAQESGWHAEFIKFFAPSYAERIVKQSLDTQYQSEVGIKTVCRTHRNLVSTPFDRRVFQDVAGRFGAPSSPIASKRIFVSRISRSKSNPEYRSLLNEQALIDALSVHGFVAVEPERFGFADQIAIFRDADVIVGLGGAGMFNAVFCREATKIVTIESSTTWVEAHANLFASSGLDYGVVFGTQVSEDQGVHKRWTLKVDEAVRRIVEHL